MKKNIINNISNNTNSDNTEFNSEINNNLTSYKQFLTNEAYSPKTKKTYIYCIEQFYKFLIKNNIDANLLTRENSILPYKDYLSDKDDKASTINQTLSAIRNYNEYMISIGKMNNNLIVKKDFIKTQNTNPCNLTKEKVAKFLNRVLTKECRYKTRNIAIIYFMIFSGARKSEVYNVKLSDVDDIEMNQQITILGKCNKERDVAIVSEEVKYYINEYLKIRNSDSKYLFVSQNGNRFSESTLNKIFEFYSTPKCKVHPHDLRHWAATNMLNNGYKINEVQEQLGHSDISSTGIYLLNNMNDIKNKAKKMKAC